MITTVDDFNKLLSELEDSYGGFYALIEELGIDTEVIDEINSRVIALFFSEVMCPPWQFDHFVKFLNGITLSILEVGFRLGKNSVST